MPEDNATIARRWYQEVWDLGHIEAADDMASPDCKLYGHAPGNAPVGLQEFKEFAHSIRAAFPDVKIIVEQTVSEGDRCVVRWRSEMTHMGVFMGAAPTRQRVTVHGMSLIRFENGKIVEGWDNWDQLGLLTQIGARPVVNLAKAC